MQARGRALRGLGVISASFMIAAATPARASVVVTNWQLGVILDNSADGNFELQGFTAVQNPFMDSHIAMPVPTSFAQAAYVFAWSEYDASFQANISNQASDVPTTSSLHSRTSGFIFVRPSLDSVLSVHASYSYGLPPDSFLAQSTVVVRDATTNTSIWTDSRSANSFAGNHVAGSFVSSNGNIALIGGHTYALQYDYRLSALGGGTAGIGTGVGGIQWTLNAVPEVSSLCMLVSSIPVLLRRRRFLV